MAKKIIPIYTGIDDYVAERFANAINDAERFGDDIEVRISTSGGSVEQGYTILSLIDNFKGNKSIRIDGRAHSMGAFMPLYADDVEALDVSNFVLHRAGYWFEGTSMFTDAHQKQLDTINNGLKSKMKAKLNADAFKDAFGISIDEMFKGERKDYPFDAKTAKKIGLISRIKTLNAVTKNEINAICSMNEITALYEDSEQAPESTENKEHINSNTMTIDQLKKDHPEVVQALTKEITANVSAWGAFMEIDAKTAMEGMKTGVAPTPAEIATMNANFIKASANKTETPDASTETPETPDSETPPAGAEASATASPDASTVDPRFAELEKMHGINH